MCASVCVGEGACVCVGEGACVCERMCRGGGTCVCVCRRGYVHAACAIVC